MKRNWYIRLISIILLVSLIFTVSADIKPNPIPTPYPGQNNSPGSPGEIPHGEQVQFPGQTGAGQPHETGSNLVQPETAQSPHDGNPPPYDSNHLPADQRTAPQTVTSSVAASPAGSPQVTGGYGQAPGYYDPNPTIPTPGPVKQLYQEKPYYQPPPLYHTATGSIQVTSVPTGADVYLNNIYQGQTPQYGYLEISDITPGTYSLLITCPGYDNYVVNVYVYEDETDTVRAVLNRNFMPFGWHL